MQISINTKEDSPADIRKVIALLSKMIEDSPVNDSAPARNSSIFDNSTPVLGASSENSAEPATGNAFAAMFGGDNSSSGSTPVEGTPVLGEASEEATEEKKEEANSIVEY